MCQVCAEILKRLIWKGKISKAEVLSTQDDIINELKTQAKDSISDILTNLSDEEIKEAFLQQGKGIIH